MVVVGGLLSPTEYGLLPTQTKQKFLDVGLQGGCLPWMEVGILLTTATGDAKPIWLEYPSPFLGQPTSPYHLGGQNVKAGGKHRGTFCRVEFFLTLTPLPKPTLGVFFFSYLYPLGKVNAWCFFFVLIPLGESQHLVFFFSYLYPLGKANTWCFFFVLIPLGESQHWVDFSSLYHSGKVGTRWIFFFGRGGGVFFFALIPHGQSRDLADFFFGGGGGFFFSPLYPTGKVET